MGGFKQKNDFPREGFSVSGSAGHYRPSGIGCFRMKILFLFIFKRRQISRFSGAKTKASFSWPAKVHNDLFYLDRQCPAFLLWFSRTRRPLLWAVRGLWSSLRSSPCSPASRFGGRGSGSGTGSSRQPLPRRSLGRCTRRYPVHRQPKNKWIIIVLESEPNYCILSYWLLHYFTWRMKLYFENYETISIKYH